MFYLVRNKLCINVGPLFGIPSIDGTEMEPPEMRDNKYQIGVGTLSRILAGPNNLATVLRNLLP